MGHLIVPSVQSAVVIDPFSRSLALGEVHGARSTVQGEQTGKNIFVFSVRRAP
jgi:hypothetical protein